MDAGAPLPRGLTAVLAGLALVLNVAAWSRPALASSGQTTHKAGLVVSYGDGRVVRACVRFNEDSLSGFELLRRAGLPVSAQVGGLGAAVCAIGGTGCQYPATSCFCQCENPALGCAYWAYGQWTGTAWQYAGVGALARKVTDGQIDGWAWDVGSATPTALRLPAVSLDALCADAAAATATSAVAAPTRPTFAPSTTPEPSPSRAPNTVAAPPTFAATVPPSPTETALPAATPTGTSVPAPAAAVAATATAATPSGPPASLIAFGTVLVALLGIVAASRLRRSGD